MKRSFFQYCVDNMPLMIYWFFVIALGTLSWLDGSPIMCGFFTFCFVFSIVAALIDHHRHG